MEKFDIKIALSTGSKKEMSYKLSVIGYEPLTADIIIGTHALIYDKTEFKDLALAVIDEQHRFGVEQRKALLEKVTKKTLDTRHSTLDTKFPHLLSMTATPIPRSLALALYGDLDLSIIKEVPKGRQPIATFVVPEHKRAGGYDFIRKEIRAGRQAFVICPLIDESDKLGVKSAKAEYEKLAKEVYPDLRIGLLHGKMKAKDKEGTMRDFLEAKVQILVSTSVVEVGVDVPNATIMVIEGADRFGLAQLHQFRGRVGRGAHKSYCFLFTESDAEKTMKRLDALAKNNSGFDLAKIDLELRGPGEVYGTSQSGFPELKVATLFDYELMKKARAEAEIILNNDEKLAKYPLIKETLGKIGSKHLE